jgi:foldase protein PrsA
LTPAFRYELELSYMKIFRLLVLLAALALVLAAAGCGGGDDKVPADAVAVVDGDEIPRTEYEQLLDQAKTGYKNRKQDFPAAGSTEFQTLKNQAVQYLVQRVEFRQKAEDLDIEVTDKQVDQRLEQIKKQYFGGDQKKYDNQLKAQGLTEEQVKAELRGQLISEKIFAKVTSDVKVTDKEIEKYYEEKKATQYSQPESRDVRHILVKTKAKADDIEAQLKDGADFGALAKKFSEDTGSKATGGKLTITRGQTVKEFDLKAFSLKKNEISEPVKTQFGFHIIQALSEVKPAKVTPLKDVKDAIEAELKQTKKNEKMTAWAEDLKKEYKDKVSYAVGFSPPPETTTTGTTTTG